MAYKIKINATATFEDNQYSVPFELLATNLQISSSPLVIDLTSRVEYLSLNEAISVVSNALTFNPLNIATVYTTNSLSSLSNVNSLVKKILDDTAINYQYLEAENPIKRFSDWQLTNGESLYLGSSAIPADCSTSGITFTATSDIGGLTISTYSLTNYTISGYYYMFPYVAFNGESFDLSLIDGSFTKFEFTITGTYALVTGLGVTSASITITKNESNNIIYNNISTVNDNMEDILSEGDIEYADDENPYGSDVSVFGGGDGDPTVDPDVSEKVEFPELPELSAASAGFITMYNPSKSQMNSLSNYLWSDPFDLESFKKLFSNPMDAIIGLSIVPVQPTLSGSSSVKFGNVDSGITMPVIGTQYVEFDCGSITIGKEIGCFLDYEPYTQIQIYVPYSGMHPISCDDVMGKSIHLKYNIDCLSGGCAAMLYVEGRGVLYQWNGNCALNVPLTAINYASAIQNAVSAAASVASIGIGAATGAAPLTMAGVAGLAGSAANTALNSKPTFERSGNMGGSAGLMSVQTPYIVISRPNKSVPRNMNKFIGNTTNVTMKLSACQGFTMIDLIHLDGIPCTESERDELEALLKQGVIF